MRTHTHTYFVTTVTYGRRAILQSHLHAGLLRELLFRYRDEGRYRLHGFVIMPDHLHLLMTPGAEQSLERCLQCVKGGFSYQIRKVRNTSSEIWQTGFHEHRIRDFEDYVWHQKYIELNPQKRGLRDHPYMAIEGTGLDGVPVHLGG